MKAANDSGRILRYAVAAAAAVCIAIGLMRHEYAEVLAKAVRVCLECIGIG